MNPFALVDEFGMWEMIADVVIPVAMEGDVGCPTVKMIAPLGSSHGHIELWTAVAAGDTDGGAGMLAKWFKHLLAEVVDVGNQFLRNMIVDTTTDSRG